MPDPPATPTSRRPPPRSAAPWPREPPPPAGPTLNPSHSHTHAYPLTHTRHRLYHPAGYVVVFKFMPLTDPSHGSWEWSQCLTLAAILAATDPVAVVAALHELGAPRTLASVIDGYVP